MFLKMISLKNVKCFSDITLSFESENDSSQSFESENDSSRSFEGNIRKWTLLLAENGMGKSTLLKAIALATSGSEAIAELLEESSNWVRCGEQNCEISALLATKDGKEREVRLIIEHGDAPEQVAERNEASLAWLDGNEEEDRDYFVLGFGASRRFSTENGLRTNTLEFTNKRTQRVATLFNPDASITRFDSRMMPFADIIDDLIKHLITDLIKAHIKDLTGEDITDEDITDNFSDFLPEIKYDSIDKQTGQLLFDTPDGIVPLHCLSDGYLAIATWMGDLLLQVLENFEDFKDSGRSPFSKRGLLLIDEIDLHLHPKHQRQLLTFLHKCLPNFQFVVTTHSPMTAQQAHAAELHCLTREAEGISLFPFLGNPRILLLHQLIMSPLFGLDTDESKKVENMKNRYRQLRDKSERSSTEDAEFEELGEDLTHLPIAGRSNINFAQLFEEITDIIGGGI